MSEGSQIQVNGEARSLPTGLTVAKLLDELDLTPETVAVELNREIVRRGDYVGVELKPGDKLEIVRFVQGG